MARVKMYILHMLTISMTVSNEWYKQYTTLNNERSIKSIPYDEFDINMDYDMQLISQHVGTSKITDNDLTNIDNKINDIKTKISN